MTNTEVTREVEQVVEKNRRLIQEADTGRVQRAEDVRRARESLRRAQALIRRAAAGGG